MTLEDDKTEKAWKPYETEGERFAGECAICGKTIFGKAYTPKYYLDNMSKLSTVIDPNKVSGIFCNNCGYTICWGLVNQHINELKAYGFGKFRAGICPVCGKSFIKDVTQRSVLHSGSDLALENGRCMTCGQKKPLQTVTVWSGIPVEVNRNSNYIQDLLQGSVLGDLLPGPKAKKIIEVQKNEYEVCESCSAAKKPEEHTKISRSMQKQLPYEIQRKPFTEAELEGKAN
jgi:predicted nucleic-acid-binding Zn-ribbon protein